MSVCISFQVLTQLGGCTNFNRKEIKGSGGQLRSIYPTYSSWGLKRIRLQITDSVCRWLSIQDARMGFHICIVAHLLGIPVLPLCEARLMIMFFLSSLPYIAHVKPVNAAASRASSLRLK